MTHDISSFLFHYPSLFTVVTHTIWPEFLAIVREEVGSRVVETWFKAIVLHRWDVGSKTVFLQAPNPFIQSWVTQHYTGLFEQHLGRLLNEQRITVQFIDRAVTAPTAPLAKKDVVLGQPHKEPVQRMAASRTHALAKQAPPARPRSSVNEQYRFDTFVVGPHNSLAYAAAHAISEKPGRLYNPFFIYGSSGLGKTHLLHAIGNAIKERDRNCRIVYQSADRFVNEFINAIRFDKVYQFETKYKDVDLLLIDDMQFLAHKEQTQEAFFHIFNTLHQAQKQIVFTSDSLPREIAGLADRMRSRLESGLITDISKPTLETKIAIIRKKAEAHHEQLTDEVAEYIASTVLSNVRELEGALIRVFAFASLTQQPLTLELAAHVLARTVEAQRANVDLPTIATRIAHYFDYTLQDLKSAQRNKDISFARHITMYLMKQCTRHSLRDIGKFLSRKDHSTIIHALEKIELKKQQDPQFVQLLTELERRINAL